MEESDVRPLLPKTMMNLENDLHGKKISTFKKVVGIAFSELVQRLKIERVSSNDDVSSMPLLFMRDLGHMGILTG